MSRVTSGKEEYNFGIVTFNCLVPFDCHESGGRDTSPGSKFSLKLLVTTCQALLGTLFRIQID